MALNFPNQSRSYSSRPPSVRFWGHDGALEIAFILDVDALSQISPQMSHDESGALQAFDSNRDHINAVAGEVYARTGRHACLLVPSDF